LEGEETMRYVRINLSELRKLAKIKSSTEDIRLEIFINEDVKILYPEELKVKK